jgi:hypothetical protein
MRSGQKAFQISAAATDLQTGQQHNSRMLSRLYETNLDDQHAHLDCSPLSHRENKRVQGGV